MRSAPSISASMVHRHGDGGGFNVL
jgi:hypothetical protein